MGAMNGHEENTDIPQELPPFEIPPPDLRHVIRQQRPWRQRAQKYSPYNQFQKARAIRLLNQNVPVREIARLMGPRCSCANPIRWRREAERDARFMRFNGLLPLGQLPLCQPCRSR